MAKKSTQRIILLCLFLVFAIYLSVNIVKLIVEPTDIFVVEDGSLSQEEEAECYIIRSETVLQGENYKNGMAKIKAEGERVSIGGAVFRYYTKNEQNLVQKIAELDKKIDEAMQNQTPLLTSDILLLESKIESQMDEVYKQNDISKIKRAKQDIEEAITKKATIAGDLSPASSYVKKLIDERAGYENELNSGTETVTTSEAGIVSYKVDGLEKVLTPDSFENISAKFLDDLNLKNGQVVSSNEECGKVINNFKFYIATVLKSDEAKEAEVGDSVKLCISGAQLIKAKIVHINEEEEARVIIFETSSYVEELISFRKMWMDVVWWSDSGLKVPNSAIIQEGDLHYVTRNRAGYLDKILVKVLRKNENYSIVDNYDNEELKELGFTRQEIINMKNISLYDEIVLQ